ncbi:unnamed protein product [Pseudo-nitzschia multistriata]|uniref:Uncharacterized protein n=1 Tax=Pseudo-nitzschia multistriata TaxID=183589 RepID=A0A448ZT39_9STRA|nr:unnamed protein product [Pseudo-nitzschia multistriata]
MSSQASASHRGLRGSSGGKKKATANPSLISLFCDGVDAKPPNRASQKLNSNILASRHRNLNNSSRRRRDRSGSLNLLPEIDNVRKIGVPEEGEKDATPQELYAIGAVFDHLYRGGSLMSCVRVFRKEVNRPSINFGCGLNFGMMGHDDEEDNTIYNNSTYNDDETLPTMDDGSYARERSFNTFDDGTYDPSLFSRDSTLESSIDTDRVRGFKNKRIDEKTNRPWDEQTERYPPTSRRKQSRIRSTNSSRNYRRDKSSKNNRGHKQAPDEETMSNLWDGVTEGNSPPESPKGSSDDLSSPPRLRSVLDDFEQPSGCHGFDSSAASSKVKTEAEEAIVRLKTWTDVLIAAAKENGPKVAAAASAAANAAGATAFRKEESSSSSTDDESDDSTDRNDPEDVTNLVHMMRNTEDTKDSPTALKAALMRTFSSNLSPFLKAYQKTEDGDGEEGKEDEGKDSSDSSYNGNGSPPLNSLAMRMQNMAYKEPTRTFAVSEQNQLTPERMRHEKLNIKKKADSVVPSKQVAPLPSSSATVGSSSTSPQSGGQRKQAVGSPVRGDAPSVSQRSVRSSGKGVAAASVAGSWNTETIGSHRGGDTSSVNTSSITSVNEIPSTIRLDPVRQHSSPLSTRQRDAASSPLARSLSRLSGIALDTSPPSGMSRKSSTASVSLPRRRSLFRRRSSPDNQDKPLADNSGGQQEPSTPRRKGNLPPVPPPNSSTTPSSRKHRTIGGGSVASVSTSGSSGTNNNTPPQSGESDADEATVATPPKEISKSESQTLKKRFPSFRRKGSTKKEHPSSNSPRSAMDLKFDNAAQFQLGPSTEFYHDGSVIDIDDESNIGAVDNYVLGKLDKEVCETSSTDGLLAMNDNSEHNGFEVQSVEI